MNKVDSFMDEHPAIKTVAGIVGIAAGVTLAACTGGVAAAAFTATATTLKVGATALKTGSLIDAIYDAGKTSLINGAIGAIGSIGKVTTLAKLSDGVKKAVDTAGVITSGVLAAKCTVTATKQLITNAVILEDSSISLKDKAISVLDTGSSLAIAGNSILAFGNTLTQYNNTYKKYNNLNFDYDDVLEDIPESIWQEGNTIRGKDIDKAKLIENNLGDNYPTVDRLDNQTVYSNKSIDPFTKTYSSENNNFYNKMKSYINAVNEFSVSSLKRNYNNGFTDYDYDNKALNLVLPNKSLPEFQVNALKEIKTYANKLNIDVKVHVTSGK